MVPGARRWADRSDGVAHAAERSSPARSLPGSEERLLRNAWRQSGGAGAHPRLRHRRRAGANRGEEAAPLGAQCGAPSAQAEDLLGPWCRAQGAATGGTRGSRQRSSGARAFEPWASPFGPSRASPVGSVRAHRVRVCAWQGHNWTTMASMFDVCDRTAKRLFEGAKQALGFAGTGLSRSRAPRTSFTLHEQH